MKILTFTTLFPNAIQPVHGVFVENRLRHLVSSGRVSARVAAPVPWFPFTSRVLGRYAELARVPRSERRHGVQVDHPRYPVLPKVGMNVAPLLMYLALKPYLARLIRDGHDFDLIDAHYFYPDGVAAARLGRAFSKPVTITARGTDLNLIPRSAIPRKQIEWAARSADGLITVCQALKDELVAMGVAAERVRVLRNGVDLDMFRPSDRRAARDTLGLAGGGRVLASVGLLIPRKGHDLTIRALPRLGGTTLLIAGDGPDRGTLERLARDLGVAERVRFLGRVPHEGLRDLYSAADALVLASSREGWPNVLLEAMACGTPVVASDVWGTGEVVAGRAAGVLMRERTAEALADAVNGLLEAPPSREETRAYAEGFSWDATTKGQIEMFSEILSSPPTAA